mmetsp:Transcript_11912/g.38150  ORF Transcript_11912/g.38150 Transcript_11912/m.38150 type:complete len:203 (+) Transcript_11912:41-649(+)
MSQLDSAARAPLRLDRAPSTRREQAVSRARVLARSWQIAPRRRIGARIGSDQTRPGRRPSTTSRISLHAKYTGLGRSSSTRPVLGCTRPFGRKSGISLRKSPTQLRKAHCSALQESLERTSRATSSCEACPLQAQERHLGLTATCDHGTHRALQRPAASFGMVSISQPLKTMMGFSMAGSWLAPPRTLSTGKMREQCTTSPT